MQSTINDWNETGYADRQENDYIGDPVVETDPTTVHQEYDLETRPDAVPETPAEAIIEYAEALLMLPGRETGLGHHEEIRRSMQEWASGNDDRERVHYSMSPDERNFGTLTGDGDGVTRRRKAEAVINWARDTLDDSSRQYAYDQWIEQLREACETRREEIDRREETLAFIEDPPETYNGWERFEPDKPDAVLVYRGRSNDTDRVAVVYETESGDLDGHGTTLESWRESDTAAETMRNAPFIASRVDGVGIKADLKKHLDMFDAVPIDDSQDWPDFDEYGPTMDRPVPEAEARREPWKEGLRERGFSPGVLRDEAFSRGDWHHTDEEPHPDREAAIREQEREAVLNDPAREIEANVQAAESDGALVADGGVTARRDVADITDLEMGDEIVLDTSDEMFTVLKPVYEPTGNAQVGVKVLDMDLRVFELRIVRTGETFLDLRPDDDNAAVRHVPRGERIKDFQVIGNDPTRVEQWERQQLEQWGEGPEGME